VEEKEDPKVIKRIEKRAGRGIEVRIIFSTSADPDYITPTYLVLSTCSLSVCPHLSSPTLGA